MKILMSPDFFNKNKELVKTKNNDLYLKISKTVNSPRLRYDIWISKDNYIALFKLVPTKDQTSMLEELHQYGTYDLIFKENRL